MKKIIYFSFALACASCQNATKTEELPLIKPADSATVEASNNATTDTITKTSEEKKATYQVTNAAEGTFGYFVEFEGQKIMQTTIPGMPGVKGFKTKEDAEKTAQLVAHKMEQHIFPPVITPRELDSMKIKR